MSIEAYTDVVIQTLRQHNHWLLPVVFLLAFGESLAFLSLLIPATVILLAAGALLPEVGASFIATSLAAASGAFIGDWVSFIVGRHYQERLTQIWPFTRHPHLLPKGQAFFSRWGLLGVFFGRFLGPLRATVPLVAGTCRMPFWKFQSANLASALVWGFGILVPGAFGIGWLKDVW